jgi:hypothetical protein
MKPAFPKKTQNLPESKGSFFEAGFPLIDRCILAD